MYHTHKREMSMFSYVNQSNNFPFTPFSPNIFHRGQSDGRGTDGKCNGNEG